MHCRRMYMPLSEFEIKQMNQMVQNPPALQACGTGYIMFLLLIAAGKVIESDTWVSPTHRSLIHVQVRLGFWRGGDIVLIDDSLTWKYGGQTGIKVFTIKYGMFRLPALTLIPDV